MRIYKFLSLLFIVVLTLSACNLPSANQAPADNNPNAIFTAAAQTVEAQLTQNALAAPSSTPTLTEAPAAVNAPTSTDTPAPAVIPSATNTTAPVVVVPTTACDAAKFIADITVPDNTVFTGNASFTKTWRLQNIGTCTWDSSYKLVYDSGSALGGPASVPLAGTVAPGQMVDVSVGLQAPAGDGTYKGLWGLSNSANVRIPIAGGFSGLSFSVLIQVNNGGGSSGGSGGPFAVTHVEWNVTHTGSCGGTVKYTVTATITANGPGSVTYHWTYSDGGTDTLTHDPVVFSAAGTQSVSNTWQTSASGLWMGIYIDTPNHQDFGHASLNCP